MNPQQLEEDRSLMMNKEKLKYPQFIKGNRVRLLMTNKTGTINYLRDDSCEQNKRKTDPTHYYYFVDYDDGSFETYQSQHWLVLL